MTIKQLRRDSVFDAYISMLDTNRVHVFLACILVYGGFHVTFSDIIDKFQVSDKI